MRHRRPGGRESLPRRDLYRPAQPNVAARRRSCLLPTRNAASAFRRATAQPLRANERGFRVVDFVKRGVQRLNGRRRLIYFAQMDRFLRSSRNAQHLGASLHAALSAFTRTVPRRVLAGDAPTAHAGG
jgi:hypothetical protein